MTANHGKRWAQESSPVNGTERRVAAHPPTDWNAVDWRRANDSVRRLRQRIFRASQQGNLKKVRSLQKLMLRSYANRLVSVRRVAQENAGSRTAGVDKVLCKTPKSRGMLVDQLSTFTPWKAKPAKRVYIPKASTGAQAHRGALRPLGIPVLQDRALQAMVKNALEPFWEAHFEATSYGFRPGRGCHDAIEDLFCLASKRPCRRPWVLDADIKGAFDNISHEHLLQVIGPAPGRELVRQWLKAGYVEMGALHPTEAGTPQGGVISPLLANIALHGMEKALGIKRYRDGTNRTGRAVVRYADDFVVFCQTCEDAQAAKEALAVWLAERGLAFSPEKTRIVHLGEGFDFLGFSVKRYTRRGRKDASEVLHIKPSKQAQQKLRDNLRRVWRQLRGQEAAVVCERLNSIIRGWANYYRTSVASRCFQKLDRWMWGRCVRHVRRKHCRKSWHWLRQRYWGRLNPYRQDDWVFGDKAGTGVFLWKFGWHSIERHIKVAGTASPDDPSLRSYWEKRRWSKVGHYSAQRRNQAYRQQGRCPVCGESILPVGDKSTLGIFGPAEEVHSHHKTPRKRGGSDAVENRELLHLFCHQRVHAEAKKTERTLASSS